MSPARKKIVGATRSAAKAAAAKGSAAKASGSKASGEMTTCPWCSGAVPVEAATCPSCGASLRDAVEGDVLGVTQIDPAAVARAKRNKPRRITAWLTGDSPAEEETGGKVEPPTDEVKREMLRLRLAAIDAELEAKASQAAAQRDLPLDDAAEPKSG